MAETSKKAIEKLKDLLGMEYEDFVKNLGEFANDDKIVAAIEAGKKDGKLSDEKVVFTPKTIAVRKLHPTQSEIDVDKSLAFQLDGKYPKGIDEILKGDNVTIKAPIITLNGKYIIDGHHRWSQVYSLNKDATMNCLNMEIDEDPIDVLKAVQMAIVATLGEVPTQNVEGHNLLKTDEDTIKRYIIDNASDAMMEVLLQDDKIAEKSPEEVADFMWSNIKAMQKTSQPIEGAPNRDLMPQTDDAETDNKSWKDLLKAGVINFKEPIAHESNQYQMKHIKLFESFQVNEAELSDEIKALLLKDRKDLTREENNKLISIPMKDKMKVQLAAGYKVWNASEGREKFLIIAKDLADAKDQASIWNAELKGEVKNFKLPEGEDLEDLDFRMNQIDEAGRKDQKEITSMDEMRVADIIKKAGGTWNTKAEQLTKQMANAITDGYKALRRGLAAEDGNWHQMAKIFFLKAGSLGITESIVNEERIKWSKKTVNEKWGEEIAVKEPGKYKDWTLEELRAARAELKSKDDHTAEETSKLREINFAIRAKTGWGKVK